PDPRFLRRNACLCIPGEYIAVNKFAGCDASCVDAEFATVWLRVKSPGLPDRPTGKKRRSRPVYFLSNPAYRSAALAAPCALSPTMLWIHMHLKAPKLRLPGSRSQPKRLEEAPIHYALPRPTRRKRPGPTPDRLVDSALALIDGVNLHLAGGSTDTEWFWRLVADESSFVFIGSSVGSAAAARSPRGFDGSPEQGAFVGREENDGILSDWAVTRPTLEVKSIDPYLDGAGKGVHIVEVRLRFLLNSHPVTGYPPDASSKTTSTGAARTTSPPPSHLPQMHNIPEEAAHERTVAALIKARGEPEGCTEARDAMSRLISAVCSQDIDACMREIADDATFLDPNSVFFGKESIRGSLEQWFGLGLRRSQMGSEVISLTPYSAIVRVSNEFVGTPDGAGAKHTCGTNIVTVDPKTGLVTRVAAVPVDEEDRSFLRELNAWELARKELAA
ncbi:hypothetical protein DFJ74DRAFT_729988, partial [Hyaloraphidium curvatum]